MSLDVKICAIPKCGRPIHGRGLCTTHCKRQDRNPDADMAKPVWEPSLKLHDVSTRVSGPTWAALERSGGVYRTAGDVLESWAGGFSMPKRKRGAR